MPGLVILYIRGMPSNIFSVNYICKCWWCTNKVLHSYKIFITPYLNCLVNTLRFQKHYVMKYNILLWVNEAVVFLTKHFIWPFHNIRCNTKILFSQLCYSTTRCSLHIQNKNDLHTLVCYFNDFTDNYNTHRSRDSNFCRLLWLGHVLEA